MAWAPWAVNLSRRRALTLPWRQSLPLELPAVMPRRNYAKGGDHELSHNVIGPCVPCRPLCGAPTNAASRSSIGYIVHHFAPILRAPAPWRNILRRKGSHRETEHGIADGQWLATPWEP